MQQRASGLEREFLTLHEFVKAARMKLNPYIWDYLVGATETETTMRRNRLALDAIALRPRVLRDVSHIDSTSAFLAKPIRLPVLLAPIGSLESFDAGGGMTVAKAAAQFGVPMLLSSVTTFELEAVRKAGAGGVMIFQLYVRGDDAWVDRYAERAIASGYDAFCITVDTALYSRRERDIAKRFVKPWRTAVGGSDMTYQAALSWKNIERFKRKHRIPLLLKGIATAEDARIAIEHGVEIIYVSNHGGRQLDHGRGAMDFLPEVLDVTAGKARVVVDGGFCRGTDILKAIAMGADAVGIGRLFCYGLAAAGQGGIVRLLEILEQEAKAALGLIGVTQFGALDRSCLHFGAPIVADPHVHSAFPLLDLDDEGYGGR